MTPSNPKLPWRLRLLPVGGSAALVLLGVYPTLRLSGEDGVRAMLAAQVIVIAVTYATMRMAMRRMRSQPVQRRFQIALAAGVARLFATVAIAAAVAVAGRLRLDAFMIWIVISYVIMIKIETVILVRWSSLLERNS